MSRHSCKVALVPSAFFDRTSVRDILSRTVRLDQEDKVECISLPEFSAELVYSFSGSEEPELYHVLKALSGLPDHNRIVASYSEEVLSLAIAQGGNLLLANTFKASDFTTAEYFIFMAVKKLQLNPAVSTIHFLTSLSGEEEMSLYRYFKSVEQL